MRRMQTTNLGNGSHLESTLSSNMAYPQPSSVAQSTPPSPTRGRGRYPASLSREEGRVPLHKRGNSRTYETMEDLLREAGYKETRIFTPETERIESREADPSARSASRVGAVVDFLAGWMSGTIRSEDHLSTDDSRSSTTKSTPSSPLAGKRTKPLPSTSTSPTDLTLRISETRRGAGRGRYSLPTDNAPRQPSSASDSLRAYAATQGYLRHMASTPNISKSQLTSDKHAPPTRLPKNVQPGYDHSQRHVGHPPMPAGWLDSVTKAVMGSSTSGAHAGRPTAGRQPHRTHSHLALADHTNKVRPMTGSLRADTAPGAVNTVMVVCRSAPSSRSSSRVGERLSYVSDKMARQQRGGRVRAPRKSRGADFDAVPTLTSTRLENDEWSMQWVNGIRVPSVVPDDLDWSDDNDEDEDDGEIDLARLLVPPKRQKSIRSLRQHLQRCDTARALHAPTLQPLEPYILDDDDDCADRKNNRAREHRNSRRGSMDEGSGWEGLGIPGLEQPGQKRRRGLPTTWSNLASAR